MSAAATIAAPPAERWHVVKDVLTGWRTDDPDAYPRCSVNPEHQIRNGDHYAVSGILMACLPCAGAPAPPAPTTVEPAPALAPRQQPTGKRWGWATPPQTPVMAQETAPAPRISLGPSHPDYAKPDTRETRQCGREGCERTFTARSDQAGQRFCSSGCGVRESWRLRRAASPPTAEPKPRRERVREERVCPNCGETWTANANTRRQLYCGAVCGNQATHRARRTPQAVETPAPIETPAPAVVLAPDGHDVATCPNLCCAERRRAAGLAPLPVQIGGYVFPVPSEQRYELVYSPREGRAPAAVREATA